jgi:hypothetical protein
VNSGSFCRLREKAGDEGARCAPALTPTLSREREREEETRTLESM